MPLGQVEQHQKVVKRVCHDSDLANGNVEGLGHHSATGGLDSGSRFAAEVTS